MPEAYLKNNSIIKINFNSLIYWYIELYFIEKIFNFILIEDFRIVEVHGQYSLHSKIWDLQHCIPILTYLLFHLHLNYTIVKFHLQLLFTLSQ